MLCALSAKSQSSIVFSPAEWNFGAIAEADGCVTHTFTGKNTSQRPVVILDVFTSCGCTVPEFSHKPTLPGATVQIKVTFDPMNRPGIFAKELTVYDSEGRKIAKLQIRGEVMPRQKSVEELYPVDAGRGLRLTESLCAFSYLYHGQPISSVIGLINTSNKPLRLALRTSERSGLLTLDYPREIAAGGRAEIIIGYNLPLKSSRYGTVKDVIRMTINGLDSPIPILVHGIAVDNFYLSNEIHQPKAVIDKYILKFVVLKRAEGAKKLPLRLSNTGDGVLIIRAVEMPHGMSCTLRAGQHILPGKAVVAYVTVDPAQQDYGALSEYVTLITNDPAKAMQRLRVTAIIEE